MGSFTKTVESVYVKDLVNGGKVPLEDWFTLSAKALDWLDGKEEQEQPF